MKKRQIIILASAIGIILFGYGGCRLLASMKKAPERKQAAKTVRLVKVLEVENDTLSQFTPVNGKLIARERIEIFPEVTGRLLNTSKPFKVGQTFKQGEVILAIDGRESQLNLNAQRSSFISALAQSMPDIKIDYEDSFPAWKAYLDNLEPDEELPELPEVSNPTLKNFLAGRSVFSTFYSIKSLENRQAKFTLTAPYDGSISMGNVNPGTVIRAGQKVGEFIRKDAYEFEGAVPASDAVNIQLNDIVLLHLPDGKEEFTGKITRIAEHIDADNQRVSVFASLEDERLKEGLYLEGRIAVSQESAAFSMNRNLISPENTVFVIADSVLQKRSVGVVDQFRGTAQVTGLEDGTLLLNQVIEGAFEGMPVKPDTATR